MIEQGHTVFIVSWVNPDERLGRKTFDDYMFEGPLAAMDAIEKATGESSVSIMAYCLGGTLTAITLAWLHAKKQQERVRSVVYLTTMIDFSEAGEQGDPAQFTIKFAFRNYGKTPAIVVDLQASGSYWSAGYPEALFADSHAAGEGMMIAPGEKSSTFTLVFTVNVQDLQQAYNGHGQLLFWGKLLYRDMFGELRETAFCRAYRFDDKAFRVVQVDKLNYHT